jgi:CubicO group peptidase (beta-lactamase class C family)
MTVAFHQLTMRRLGLTLTLWWVVVSLLTAWVIPAAKAQPSTLIDFDAIDRYIENEMATTRLPGLALAIVHGDQIVHLKGFGQADPTGRVVTPQLPFLIGSASKSFTALAIMQLVEAGKVDLDAPVQRYLPWFQVGQDREASALIKVRHLLNMTSGVPTFDGTTQTIRDEVGDKALENGVRALHALALTQPVGQQFQYANANYNALGLIVQTVSRQSYEAYIQHHIFAPLAMHNAYTSPIIARQHGRVTGYRYWFGWPLPYEMPFPRGTLPAGFLSVSAEDMAHYLIAQLNGGLYANRSVLSPAGMARLHQPTVPIGQDEIFYAMGWFIGNMNGVRTISHGGDLANFHTDVVLIPDAQWGVGLLMNGNNNLNHVRIVNIAPGVTRLLLGQPILPLAQGSDTRQSLLVLTWVVLAIQLFEIVRTSVLIRGWRQAAAGGPQRRGFRVWHLLPPLVLNFGWATLLLTVLLAIPFITGGDLPTLLIHTPDLGYSLLLTLVVALGWPLLRTVLVLTRLRSHATLDTGQARPALVVRSKASPQ